MEGGIYFIRLVKFRSPIVIKNLLIIGNPIAKISTKLNF